MQEYCDDERRVVYQQKEPLASAKTYPDLFLSLKNHFYFFLEMFKKNKKLK